MKVRLIEAEGGGQIVVFSAGFELAADDGRLTRAADRVIIAPMAAGAPTDLEN